MNPETESGPSPERHEAVPTRPVDPPKHAAEPPNNRALLGIVFVIVLALGAMWLVDRMRAWASLGDCAITHAPQCRELLGR